ncbi:hypothetical protein [Streptomyces noursei]|uniref:hypothetical protein n=1 Tax=Streptomyces noursei TaxID=1971 RepID=UPI0019C7B77C|nr:hypothetical protein [Streptomyces noursei]GGW94237.1 hypothetical protein GCM10010341_14200 [Streptomyces noursei]
MLDALAADRYRFVECTVTPDNTASERGVRAFAHERGAPVRQQPLFGSDHFPVPGHAPEVLYRVGPLTQ